MGSNHTRNVLNKERKRALRSRRPRRPSHRPMVSSHGKHTVLLLVRHGRAGRRAQGRHRFSPNGAMLSFGVQGKARIWTVEVRRGRDSKFSLSLGLSKSLGTGNEMFAHLDGIECVIYDLGREMESENLQLLPLTSMKGKELKQIIQRVLLW